MAPGCVPLLLTDGFKEYHDGLLTHYGQWVHLPRRQAQGPSPKPRWMPLPQLLYAQVVKTVRRRRLVRGIIGWSLARWRRSAGSGSIWLADQHGLCGADQPAIRQHVAAVDGGSRRCVRARTGLRQQLGLYHMYYNFCSRTPAYANLCSRLCRPTARAQPNAGSPRRPPWRRD